MNAKSIAAVLVLSSSSFVVACGGAGDASDAESSEADVVGAAKVTPGTFKLYEEPGRVGHPDCDIFTSLKLAAPNLATLEEDVTGLCKLAVMPNLRSYHLKLTGTSCGSQVWTGSRTEGGKKLDIEITDHRSRMCMDLQLGQVVVKETQANGTTVTKYGSETTPSKPAAGSAIEVTGTLVTSYGIGGENTGRSLRTKDATWELVLDGKESASFSENATARIRGKVQYLSGVETHDRPAIDVGEILVCPPKGWIDCMPPTTNALCKADTRSWVQASCPGVDYAD